MLACAASVGAVRRPCSARVVKICSWGVSQGVLFHPSVGYAYSSEVAQVVLDEDGAELDEVLRASVLAQCRTFLWRRYVPEPLLEWGRMRSRTSHVLERSIISDVFSLL